VVDAAVSVTLLFLVNGSLTPGLRLLEAANLAKSRSTVSPSAIGTNGIDCNQTCGETGKSISRFAVSASAGLAATFPADSTSRFHWASLK